MKSVMLDLETWGTRAGCAIRSIGAVAFDPTEESCDVPGPTFYQNVTLESCLRMKLRTDPDTVKWWDEQSSDAKTFLEVDQVHIKTACLNFNMWFRSHGEDTRVWAHGATFDIPIYEAVCHAVNFKAPWSYRGIRDTRTLFDLTGFNTKDVPFIGVEHNALDDAIHQARCVQMAMKRLANWKEQSSMYDGLKL